MNLVKKISSITLTLLLVGMLVFLPSIVYEPFMNGLQTGKTIFFLAVILIVLTLASIIIMSGRSFNSFNFSRLDMLLMIWFSYIVLKSLLQKSPFSISYAEFIGLALLYAILKFIKAEQFKWLLLALIIAGTVQAIYGNLQLWGYFPSHHNRFNHTGSFSNPGPYAGYLASIFPIALGLWIFDIKLFIQRKKGNRALLLPYNEKVQNRLNEIVFLLNKVGLKTQKITVDGLFTKVTSGLERSISIIALIIIALVLPASQSRAAWLAVVGSSVFLLAIKFPFQQKLKLLNLSIGRKIAIFLITFSVLFSGLAGMYLLKKDSANGRILIWKVTLNMIADYPYIGTGNNGFKANYMDYQAAYFKVNPETKEAMLAGDTNYAFNELLQQTAEHGLLGGFLLVLIFISAFLTHKQHNRKFQSEDTENRLIKENHFTIISKAMLLSIVIFSFFSYPSQILPIKISLIVALAYLSINQKRFFLVTPTLRNKKLHVFSVYVGKGLVLFLIAILSLHGIHFLKTQTIALKDWKFAFVLYSTGKYDLSIKEYAKAMPILHSNGDFLTNYGKALSMAGKHEKAIEILHEAAKYYPNTVVYTALGDSYKATSQNKNAETVYQHAFNMVPSRFYPLYLLAKLYDETKQDFKAKKIAKRILSKDVKVKSTAIEEIREQVQKILNKQASQQNGNILIGKGQEAQRLCCKRFLSGTLSKKESEVIWQR